jgi:hypothetical protein
LLDQTASKIGIDQPALGSLDRSSKLLSVIPSRRAKRASHFVLKVRTNNIVAP